MNAKCLLWDFGDTLCDENFIWASKPEWQSAYQNLEKKVLDDWFRGDIDAKQFARIVSNPVQIEPEAALSHMAQCCQRIDFFRSTFEFFKARHLPQAIATVNPDLWSEFVVPYFDLNKYANTIVTSWQEQTLDKGELCRIALDRLDSRIHPSQALLIDNKKQNLVAWERYGGAGYHYTTDATFIDEFAKKFKSRRQ